MDAAQDELLELSATVERLAGCTDPATLVFDATSRVLATVPPPESEESYSVTIARRISTIIGRLTELGRPDRQRVLTPRAMLLELMDIMQHAMYLSLPAEMRTVGQERASQRSAFQTYVSSRRIPVEAMAEGLYTLTYVSVKLRVELVTLQLRQRLEDEIAQRRDDVDKAAEAEHGLGGASATALAALEEELAALLVTRTLLDDFLESYTNAVLTVPVVASAAATAIQATFSAPPHSALAPGASKLRIGGPAALASVLPTVQRYYYQVSDWTLLTASAAVHTPISLTRVTSVEVNPRKGVLNVNLHRPDTTHPWGLLLNERARLVDVDAAMRVSDKAEELHALLRCSQDGGRIVSVNGNTVRSYRTQPYAEYNRAVLEAIQQASTNRKTIQLSIQSDNYKTVHLHAPAELVFSCPAQGGEGAAGQRASLFFHRRNKNTPWQFSIDAALMWFPPPPKLLSEEVRSFVRNYPYRLKIIGINGVEVQSPRHVSRLVDGVEMLLIELVVVPVAEAAHGATRVTQQAPRPKKIESRTDAPSDRMEKSVASVAKKTTHATEKAVETVVKQKKKVAVVESTPVPAVEETQLPVETAVVSKKKKKSAQTPAVDADADQILREMLRDAGVDAGDTPLAAKAAVTDGKDDMEAQAVMDEPSTVSKRKVKPSKGAKKAAANLIDDSTVSHADAEESGPCLFENDVRLVAFDGQEMQFRRPSVDQPWGIKITQEKNSEALDDAGRVLPLRMLSLPEPLPASASHPFLKQFTHDKGLWFLETVNGKVAGADTKKTLEAMRKATKMTLRLLRI